jgi:hypothetical protein
MGSVAHPNTRPVPHSLVVAPLAGSRQRLPSPEMVTHWTYAPADNLCSDGRAPFGQPLAVNPTAQHWNQIGASVIFTKELDGFAAHG